MSPIDAYRRILLTAIMATILALLSLSTVSADTTPGLRVRSADMSRFPKVSLTLFADFSATPNASLTPQNVVISENGERQETFKVEPIGSQPMLVVLTIDTSGSMTGIPLTQAKAAAKDFIQSMKPDHQLAIVGFNTVPTVVLSPTSDKNLLASAIDGLAASSGDTALYDALGVSLDICAKATQTQKNIIVLSDGADNRSGQAAQTVIKRAFDAGVAVFGVGLVSSDFDQPTLTRITSETGGRLVTTSDPQTLSALYQSLAKELNQQYSISYISDAQARTKNLDLKVTADVGSNRFTAEKAVANPRFGAASTRPAAQPSKSLLLSPVFSSVWFYPLILAALFAAVVILVAMSLPLAVKLKDPLPRALSQYSGRGDKPSDNARSKRSFRKAGTNSDPAASRKLMDGAIKMTGDLAEKRGLGETIQLMLLRAGIPLKPAEFMFFHFLAVSAVGLLALVISRSALVASLVVVAAVVLPLAYINYLINQRKKAFHDQLSDLLLMLSGSLKAGHSLLQAFRVASQEMPPPASSELKKVLTEIDLGLPIEDALDSMAARIGSENLTWTVTAIKIHLQVGGNLAALLETLAATVRERDMVARQIKALTAEGRLSAIILFVLPFILAIAMFVINRSYVVLLFQTTAGQIMVGLAMIMMIVGAIWLTRIVTIEV